MGSLLDFAPGLPSYDLPWSGAGADRPGALADFKDSMSRVLDALQPSQTCSPASLAGSTERWYRSCRTQLAQKLDKKLATWRPEVAAQVEQIVTDALDLLPSRAVVQEVLDALDERQAG